MSIKGLNINGTLYKIDHENLENKPTVPDGLPAVTESDAGKFMRVNEDGEWAAMSLSNAEEASF